MAREAGKSARRYDPRTRNPAQRRALRARVFANSDVCAICGYQVDKALGPYLPESPEIDEIIPVARGGDPYDFANLQLTHRKCNRQKSDKIPMNFAPVPIQQIPHSHQW